MDKDLMVALKEICSSKGSAVLVTIYRTKGSTPRKIGAKMLITEEGQTIGTIGGGCGEAEVKREAINALNELKSRKHEVNMTQELAADEGMVCGGVMEVLIEVLPPGQNNSKDFILAYLKAIESKAEPCLVTIIDQITSTQIAIPGKFFLTSSGKVVQSVQDQGFTQNIEKWKAIINQVDKEQFKQTGNIGMLIEPVPDTVDLIIFGGGHIALPLCNMAKKLGYRVTVVDDRPSFANRQRFIRADSVICRDFEGAIENINITTKSFIVIVTRGHRHDKTCLKAVIDEPAAYIGMIGSKRRVKALMAELEEEGISAELLGSIYSPIGLDIGAETPEEIAISILAEIIKVHRK